MQNHVLLKMVSQTYNIETNVKLFRRPIPTLTMQDASITSRNKYLHGIQFVTSEAAIDFHCSIAAGDPAVP